MSEGTKSGLTKAAGVLVATGFLATPVGCALAIGGCLIAAAVDALAEK